MRSLIRKHSWLGSFIAAAMWAATMPCKAGDATASQNVQPGSGAPAITLVWANSGEDKVAQGELRAANNGTMTNSVWDGTRVALFGAKNEVVSFNLILEAAKEKAGPVTVSFTSLTGPDGFRIETRDLPPKDQWRTAGRNIEPFFVRYLEIKGISTLTFNYWSAEDNERHLPPRLRRPHDEDGVGQGTWADRPDHNAFYPDIAVPLAFHTPFEIAARTSQSIWFDVYIPKAAPAGKYQGVIEITEGGSPTRHLPVELEVRNFSLPDVPTARTMVFVNRANINRRYLGTKDAVDAAAAETSRMIVDRHFQMAHRHKVSLVDEYDTPERVQRLWSHRLNGELFTPARGYDGPGVNVGNNVYSIGTYTTWPWQDGDEATFHAAADRWVRFFEKERFSATTDYFLYLLDESDEYKKMEQWAVWVRRNPGPGQRLRTFATIGLPRALEMTPSINIIASTPDMSMRGPSPLAAASWQAAFEKVRADKDKKFFLYNGSRPVSGTFLTDDDGIAPRQLAWLQYALGIDRWFFWESTYYDNIHHNTGETNVFRSAHTFGDRSRVDPAMGETGNNYDNGNGVLFYPGTDRVFKEESYDFSGPIASLRLKHWRRGIQDHDYLTMAAKVDAKRVKEIVAGLISSALWDGAMSSAETGTGEIGWPSDPQQWEQARRDLADIIEGAERDQTHVIPNQQQVAPN